MIEAWRKAFREGVAPNLSEHHLEVLRDGLVSDDPDIIQGSTTFPLPAFCTKDTPVQKACALAYCGWKGDGHSTVELAEDFFVRIVFSAHRSLGGETLVGHFLNAFDKWPRPVMLENLLGEVERAISQRKPPGSATTPVLRL